MSEESESSARRWPPREDRGRGQGRHTRPRAGREDRGRGRGRHTRTAGSPPPNLARTGVAETLTSAAGQGAGDPPPARRRRARTSKPRGMP